MDRIKQWFQYWLKRMFPNWKHVVIKVPIIVLVIYLVLLGVLYITSVPPFCGNLCHEMKMYYDQWRASNHANVTCIDCHVEPGFFNQLHHKIIALKELYAHITKTYEYPIIPRELAPVDESCKRCHSGKREFSLSGDLRMPHEKHVEIFHKEPIGALRGLVHGAEHAEINFEEASCIICHFNVVHAPSDADRRPQMELCVDNCHNGKRAPDNCDLCHLKKNIPASHNRPDWLKIHGSLSNDPKQNCKACHQWRPTNFCGDCHKQRPKSHTATWRTFHGDRAKADRKGCNACHQDNFCMKCHGILP